MEPQPNVFPSRQTKAAMRPLSRFKSARRTWQIFDFNQRLAIAQTTPNPRCLKRYLEPVASYVPVQIVTRRA